MRPSPAWLVEQRAARPPSALSSSNFAHSKAKRSAKASMAAAMARSACSSASGRSSPSRRPRGAGRCRPRSTRRRGDADPSARRRQIALQGGSPAPRAPVKPPRRRSQRRESAAPSSRSLDALARAAHRASRRSMAGARQGVLLRPRARASRSSSVSASRNRVEHEGVNEGGKPPRHVPVRPQRPHQPGGLVRRAARGAVARSRALFPSRRPKKPRMRPRIRSASLSSSPRRDVPPARRRAPPPAPRGAWPSCAEMLRARSPAARGSPARTPPCRACSTRRR